MLFRRSVVMTTRRSRGLQPRQEDIDGLRQRCAELEAELERAGSVEAQRPSVILENITDAFVALDHELRYVWVNAEAERLMGLARSQVLGQSMLALFPETVGSSLERKCREALARRLPQELEFYFAPHDRWYHNKIYLTPEGGLAVYWREITAEKRNELELRRQAAVLAQVHDALISTDLHGNITGWNEGACEIFGYDAGEVTGQDIALLYFDEERNRVWEDAIEPVLRRGSLNLEMRNRRKSGEECYVRLSLSLLRDEEQRPYGIIGVATDITRQVWAEQALRNSEERYRSLANAMPQIAYLGDKDGNVVFINDQARRYAGLAGEREGEGLKWLHTFHPEDAAGHFAHWKECLARGVEFERENRLRSAEGKYRWFLTRVLPIRDDGGNIVGWVGTSTDIHDHKAKEDALRASERDSRELVSGLTRANEELTHFAHVVGHDLRAPLRTVIGLTQVLSRANTERLDEQGRQLMTMITAAGLRMHKMLQDLLELAKVTQSEISQQVVCLEEALAEALQHLRSDIEEAGAVVTSDTLPQVACNQAQMVQLFQNLVGNALKYRKPGSAARVHISASSQGDEWIISVHDDGIGFQQEYAEQIFEVFQRLHGSEYSGTGMGLAICKHIVERHGGRIWATSRPGEGSVFAFSLPVKR